MTGSRTFPRWSAIKPLLGFQLPSFSNSSRVARADTVDDLRSLALRTTPRAVFDYVDGAAGDELSLRRSRRSFHEVEFRPTVLTDVSNVDTTTSILGQPSDMPIICAPTGFTRMMHTAGEVAVCRAAGVAGIPYTLSTMGTTSPEDLTAAAPDATKWFQLYLWRDRGASSELIDRAKAAGFTTLVLTVDTPVAGDRRRDRRNGLTIPPRLTPRTLVDMARHPRWWLDLITSPPIEFASLRSFDGTVAELVNKMFDPSAGIDDLVWIKDRWDGPVVVKGIQTVEDAQRVKQVGADAVVVSNHGGRQLDQAPTPLRVLPDVVAAVGSDLEVYVDGGVMDGRDIAVAVALGAKAVMVGRSYLYGLMAGGEPGVTRAFEILGAQLERTMQLVGACTTDDLVGRVRLL